MNLYVCLNLIDDMDKVLFNVSINLSISVTKTRNKLFNHEQLILILEYPNKYIV